MIDTRADFYQLFTRPIYEAEVAEIGVAEGRFSLDILRWGVKRLYLIDTWATIPGQRGDAASPQEWHSKNLADCIELLEPHFARYVLLRGRSHDMVANVPDASLDLVHLDGDHSYESVRRDLDDWMPKLRPGGIMSGHDYLSPNWSVGVAVGEYAKENKIEVLTAGDGENASFYFFKGGE